MAREIIVEFGRGESFRADLLEEDAPKNSDLVWNALPLSGDAAHCMWSGQGVFVKTADFPFEIENQLMIGVPPGTIGIEYYPPGLRSRGPRTGFIITYGSTFLFKNPFSVSNQLLLVAQIKGDLNLLAKIGHRIRHEGQEKLTLRRAE